MKKHTGSKKSIGCGCIKNKRKKEEKLASLKSL
jgi:hypothetical protein